MKQSHFVLLGLAAIVVFYTNCTQDAKANGTTDSKNDTAALQAKIKRGEYLVTIGGCNDCHTPKIMTPNGPVEDETRRLSGHPESVPLPAITDKKMLAPGQWVAFAPDLTATVGPWGTSFAANLTPDETGIGNWTYAQFAKAIREGKSKGLDGTRPLLPPMPWFNFAKMTEEDLESVYSYLKSLPPVKNNVPKPLPPVM